MLTAKYPYIFIVTYGRSGSTLLQGILNSIPDYCIRGENDGVVNHFRLACGRLGAAREKYSQIGATPADPWYGIDRFNKDRMLEALRALMVEQVLQPPEGTRCVGFKEIRYAKKMVGDLPEHLAFMRKMFPGAGFVFNSRNLDAVIRSGWWKNHENPREFLEDFESSMKAAFEQHSDYSIWIRYDDYVAVPETLASLYEFLDEPFDLARVKHTLSLKHSG